LIRTRRIVEGRASMGVGSFGARRTGGRGDKEGFEFRLRKTEHLARSSCRVRNG
jgi:hypothetical protein